MKPLRTVLVAGLTVAAATGLTTPAWAAPAPAKAPVTPDQCHQAHGKVQRAEDGVGTCVGGTSDGHLIKDVGTTRPDDFASTSDGRGSASRYGGADDRRGGPGSDDGGSYRDDDRSSGGLLGSRGDDRSGSDDY